MSGSFQSLRCRCITHGLTHNLITRSQGEMQTLAAIEVLGGVLMVPRFTRRFGGAMVAAASAAVLNSELRREDGKLAGARAPWSYSPD